MNIQRLRPLLLLIAVTLLPAFSAASAVAAGGTVTILRTNDSNMYDPQRAPARAAYEVIFMLADTLVSLDHDMKTIQPGLAKSWTVSPDGLTYTFQIREDVKFCDGKPMTAEDVAFSLRRWIAPETRSPNRARAGDVKDIRVTGKYAVQYVLNRPFNELLYQLVQPYAAIVDQETVKTLGPDFGVKGFNGTGPFCWVQWQPRDQMLLRRHDAYRWGPPIYENRGPAHVEQVIWKVVPEDTTRVAALQTDQGDITYVVPWAAIDQLKADPKITIAEPAAFGWTGYIGFKLTRDLVSDARVRRAMLLAVDQLTMVKTLWFTHAFPAFTYVAPGILDYPREMEPKLVRYNPAEANRLLDEAGWKKAADGLRYKDGKKLATLLYGQDNTGWRTALEAVQGYLRAVGVDLQLQLWEPSATMTKFLTQDYDAFAIYAAYLTAGDELNTYFRSSAIPSPNRMNWKDPETEAWLDAARAASTPQGRHANHLKVLEKLYNTTAWIPLVHERMFVVSNSSRVSGVKPSGLIGCGVYKGLDIRVK